MTVTVTEQNEYKLNQNNGNKQYYISWKQKFKASKIKLINDH